MKHFLAAALLVAVAAPVAAAAEINVTYGDKFAEKLTDDYGEREGVYLSERVREDLERALTKSGVDVVRIDVTILDAKPSRPTFKQAGDEPGLDLHRSVSIGGMKLSAVTYDAAGNASKPFEYKWFENDITQAGLTTWHDARRASSRFASNYVKAMD